MTSSEEDEGEEEDEEDEDDEDEDSEEGEEEEEEEDEEGEDVDVAIKGRGDDQRDDQRGNQREDAMSLRTRSRRSGKSVPPPGREDTAEDASRGRLGGPSDAGRRGRKRRLQSSSSDPDEPVTRHSGIVAAALGSMGSKGVLQQGSGDDKKTSNTTSMFWTSNCCAFIYKHPQTS